MDTLLFTKNRYYVAGLLALCILSVTSFTYAGNMFLFDFDKEYSLPSLYHYALLLICCFGFYWLMQSERAYDVWFYAFAYLLLDDMTTLHETAGWLLGKYVIPTELWFFSKRALGEITYLSVVGGLLGCLLVKRFFAATAAVKKQFIIFSCLIMLFGLFGVLVDSIHEEVCVTPGLLCMLTGVLEDGGEIFVTILIIHQIRQLLTSQVERVSERPSPGM
ncbi:MAG: hypothetical protein HKP56_01085 [Anderseniella sp.]|nr:hypothetical protein [Anderseniella sp.]